jgi:hypothetical protein
VMVFAVLITTVFIVNNTSRVFSLIFHQLVELGEWSPASDNYIHIKERGQQCEPKGRNSPIVKSIGGQSCNQRIIAAWDSNCLLVFPH